MKNKFNDAVRFTDYHDEVVKLRRILERNKKIFGVLVVLQITQLIIIIIL